MAAELDEGLRSYLLTLSAVTNLVGQRIRPDALDQADTLPAIVLEIDDETHLNDLTGKGGLVYSQVTVRCRATTKQQARAVAEAVRVNGTDPGTGLAGYHGAAGELTIDAVLEDEQISRTKRDDGSDRDWWDAFANYRISYSESI